MYILTHLFLIGGKHEPFAFSMASTRQSLEAHSKQMIKRCSEKVTELCKLEKETWQTVDELNEKCEAMIDQIETTTEQQVSH